MQNHKRIASVSDVAVGVRVVLLDDAEQRVVDTGVVSDVYGLTNGRVQGRVRWKLHGLSDGNLSSRFIRTEAS